MYYKGVRTRTGCAAEIAVRPENHAKASLLRRVQV